MTYGHVCGSNPCSKKRIKAIVWAAFVIPLYVPAALSQTAGNPAEIGIVPYGAYEGGAVDHVDMSNGNLAIHIPLFSLPQRGRLSLSYSVNSNSPHYSPTKSCSNGGAGTCIYGFTPDVIATPTISDDHALHIQNLPYSWNTDKETCIPDYGCGASGQTYIAYIHTVQDSTGAIHYMAYDPSTNYTTLRSVDGSGFLETVPDQLAYQDGSCGTLYDSSGTKYSISPQPAAGICARATGATSTVADLDGNNIVTSPYASQPDGYETVDSLGRTLLPTMNGNLALCPTLNYPNQPLSFAQAMSVPGPNGQNVTYTICWASFSIHTDFLMNGGKPVTTTSPAGPNQGRTYNTYNEYAAPAGGIQSIVLPNGTYWAFQYDAADPNDASSIGYGDLVSLHLPTGGTITYTYQNMESCNNTSITGYDSTYPYYYSPFGRVVMTRTVNSGSGQSQTWGYEGGAFDNSAEPYTTTVSRPDGTSSVHTFSSDADVNSPSCSAVETSVQDYQGTPTTGTLVRSVSKTYLFNPNPASLVSVVGQPYGATPVPSSDPARVIGPATIPLLQSETTSIPSGSSTISTTTTYGYDSGFNAVQPFCNVLNTSECYETWSTTVSFGRVTSKTVTGYDGTTLESTNTGYKWQSAPSYYAANLMDAPQTVSITGAGGNSSTTTYSYDENNGSPQGVLGQVFGHMTSIAKQVNPNVSVASHTVYNSLGIPTLETDGNGNQTDISAFQCSGTFPQTVTSAYHSATTVSESSTYVYDCVIGKPTSMTDPNGAITTWTFDNMGRSTGVGYPDSGGVTISYNGDPSPPLVTVTTKEGAAPIVNKVLYDGLGRTTETQLVSDPVAPVLQDTTYDPAGRVQSISNPYRAASDPTYGITSYLYDALGRKTYQCQPDNTTTPSATCVPANSYQQWSYAGNVTTFTDENKNQWQRTADALGRLTRVLEPSGSSKTPALETDYIYDALDDLTKVTQHGNGTSAESAHIRSFNYDSLGRLTSATNPETGIVCYGTMSGGTCSGNGYDANGNLLTKTDAMGNVTTQTFDALNRLKSQTYSTGDPGKVFIYDQKGTNTIGRLTYEASTGGGTLLFAHFVNVYDAMGRIKAEGSCTITTCGTGSTPTYPYYLIYGYDLAGNLTSSSPGLSGDPVLTYSYNAAGQLQQITSSWNDATIHPQTLFLADSTSTTSPAYSPFGTLENAQLSIFGGSQTPNILLNRAYDKRGRIRSGTYSAETAAASASKSSGSLTISGSEQSLPIPATSGSGSVTIQGHETTSGCPTPEDTILCHYDQGTITITVNGFAASVGYGQTSTTVSVAAALASALNASGSPVTASYGAQLPNAEVFMTAKSSGASTNYSLSATALEGSSSQPSPSFSALASGSALLGGAASAGTTYDSGALTVTVNNIAATASYGQGSSPSGIASSIASAINSAASSIVTATANGASVSLASTQAASSTNWPLAATVASSSPSTFPTASFSVSATGMSGGADAGSTATTTLYSYNLNGFATPSANPGYDSVGNVVGLQDSVVGQWQFGYDTLNRLVSATGISGGFNGINVSAASQGWTYDSFGNRTGQSAGSSQTPTQWATYSVAAANNRVATSNGAPGGLSYDGDGRLLNDGAKAYLWEMQGWLCGVTSAGNHYQYIYDAEGRLVTTASRPDAQCGLNTTTLADYIVDQFGRQITEADGSARWRHTNVYANGELLATYDSAGLHYALNDWLGDKRVQALASSTGTTVEETCWNLPFNDGFGCSGTGTDATEQHYTGKEHDKYASQLDHFGARSYTNYSGRFLSPDPSVLDRADPTNPQTLNLYVYALNNPLRYTDPTGLEAACHWGGNDWDDTPGDGGAGQGDCEQQGGTWEEVPGPETTVTVNGDTGDSSITVDTWQPNPGEMIPYVSAGCSAVPTQSTQGSLQQNIKNAEAMKPAMPWSMSYFYSNVKNGGPQDYKQNKQMADVADAGTAPFMVKSPFEDFGNFNYGATAAAQGIPLSVALRAAGYAGQKAQGASAVNAAKTAMGPAPYGDDPADQIQIQNGYNFYTRKCF